MIRVDINVGQLHGLALRRLSIFDEWPRTGEFTMVWWVGDRYLRWTPQTGTSRREAVEAVIQWVRDSGGLINQEWLDAGMSELWWPIRPLQPQT